MISPSLPVIHVEIKSLSQQDIASSPSCRSPCSSPLISFSESENYNKNNIIMNLNSSPSPSSPSFDKNDLNKVPPKKDCNNEDHLPSMIHDYFNENKNRLKNHQHPFVPLTQINYISVVQEALLNSKNKLFLSKEDCRNISLGMITSIEITSEMNHIIHNHLNNITQDYLMTKKIPFVLTNCHLMRDWPKGDFFSPEFLKSKYAQLDIKPRNVDTKEDLSDYNLGRFLSYLNLTKETRPVPHLYGKDISCPIEWASKMNELFPNALTIKGSNDLLFHLPEFMQPECLMIYIGDDGSATPGHMDICSSLGHNLMIYGQNDDSLALWFIISPEFKDEAADLWTEITNIPNALNLDGTFLNVAGMSDANFPIFYYEQKIGDAIFLPSESPHQVFNQGGTTIKISWNRITPWTISSYHFSTGPIYRRLCKAEVYRVKSICHFSLLAFNERHRKIFLERKNPRNLDVLFDGKAVNEIVQELNGIKELLKVYEDIITDDWINSIDGSENGFCSIDIDEKDRIIDELMKIHFVDTSMEYPHTRVCDYCQSDIWNRSFHCDQCPSSNEIDCLKAGAMISRSSVVMNEGIDLCLECYARGRTCSHLIMRMVQIFDGLDEPIRIFSETSKILSQYFKLLPFDHFDDWSCMDDIRLKLKNIGKQSNATISYFLLHERVVKNNLLENYQISCHCCGGSDLRLIQCRNGAVEFDSMNTSLKKINSVKNHNIGNSQEISNNCINENNSYQKKNSSQKQDSNSCSSSISSPNSSLSFLKKPHYKCKNYFCEKCLFDLFAENIYLLIKQQSDSYICKVCTHECRCIRCMPTYTEIGNKSKIENPDDSSYRNWMAKRKVELLLPWVGRNLHTAYKSQLRLGELGIRNFDQPISHWGCYPKKASQANKSIKLKKRSEKTGFAEKIIEKLPPEEDIDISIIQETVKDSLVSFDDAYSVVIECPIKSILALTSHPNILGCYFDAMVCQICDRINSRFLTCCKLKKGTLALFLSDLKYCCNVKYDLEQYNESTSASTHTVMRKITNSSLLEASNANDHPDSERKYLENKNTLVIHSPETERAHKSVKFKRSMSQETIFTEKTQPPRVKSSLTRRVISLRDGTLSKRSIYQKYSKRKLSDMLLIKNGLKPKKELIKAGKNMSDCRIFTKQRSYPSMKSTSKYSIPMSPSVSDQLQAPCDNEGLVNLSKPFFNSASIRIIKNIIRENEVSFEKSLENLLDVKLLLLMKERGREEMRQQLTSNNESLKLGDQSKEEQLTLLREIVEEKMIKNFDSDDDRNTQRNSKISKPFEKCSRVKVDICTLEPYGKKIHRSSIHVFPEVIVPLVPRTNDVDEVNNFFNNNVEEEEEVKTDSGLILAERRTGFPSAQLGCVDLGVSSIVDPYRAKECEEMKNLIDTVEPLKFVKISKRKPLASEPWTYDIEPKIKVSCTESHILCKESESLII